MGNGNDRLIAGLANVIERLDDGQPVGEYLSSLGRDHRKYGIPRSHFDLVSECLVAALKENLGDHWTLELDMAWRDVIAAISGAMTQAADAETGPPAWVGTIIEHTQFGQDMAVVRLELDQPLPYHAGQYVSVHIPHRPRMWRHLSLATPQREDNIIEFHVRKVSGGWVSTAIFSDSRVGETWVIGSPMGELALPPDGDALMIASGTGIAPLRAQILEVAEGRAKQPRSLVLYYGGRYPSTLYDIEVLQQLEDQLPWLTVIGVTQEENDPSWLPPGMWRPNIRNRVIGRVGDVVVADDAWRGRDVQISGSPAMVTGVRNQLLGAGASLRDLHFDPLI
jgi:NAD(P)H-flavin reductase